MSKVTYLGNHIEYSVASEIGELFIVEADVSRYTDAGTSVIVSFANHGVTLIRT